MASHDLRHPLTNIGIRLYLLEKVLADEAHLRHVEQLKEQTGKLQTMIEDMLLLMQLESKPHPHFVLTPVTTLVDTLTNRYQERCEGQGIVFTTHAPTDVQIEMDLDLMIDAVSRLLDNAITYARSAGQIALRVTDSDGRLEFCVEDDGPGIPQAQLNKVSEAFFRGDDARSTNTGGAGLGMAIAKAVAVIHGGDMRVDSTLGEGTSVALMLPHSVERASLLVGTGAAQV